MSIKIEAFSIDYRFYLCQILMILKYILRQASTRPTYTILFNFKMSLKDIFVSLCDSHYKMFVVQFSNKSWTVKLIFQWATVLNFYSYYLFIGNNKRKN